MQIRFFHRYGFGVQSPSAYSLIRNVLYEKLGYYVYDDLRTKYPDNKKRQRRRDEQLFRLVNYFKPHEILVVGECDDCTKEYMTASCGSVVESVADHDSVRLYAKRLNTYGLIYVTPNLSLQCLDMMLSEWRFKDKQVLVIDDIRKSNKRLWRTSLSEVYGTLAFDMRYRGVICIDRKRQSVTYSL